MATAKKATAKKPGTGLQKWSADLAKYAQAATATAANTGEGIKTFSMQSGVLSLDEEPMPNNEMAVIIINAVHEHAFYETEYQAGQVTPPTCFAIAALEKDLAPHETVIARDQAQAESCAVCPHNQFGSAARGRGKACSNKYRLLLIPAGNFDRVGKFKPIDDPEHFATAEAAFLKTPVTSGKLYAAYAGKLEKTLGYPPFAVYTKIKLVPDAKSQFLVTFEALGEVDEDIIETLIKRHEESAEAMLRPFNLDVEEDQQPAKGRGGKGAKAPPAKKGAAAKQASPPPKGRQVAGAAQARRKY